jgi:hypothetical protein
MGRKVSDGKAFDAVAPAGQVINDGDLFRIGGWNGSAIGQKDGVQADRAMSFEDDTDAIYSILVPVALAPAVGALLYWTANDITTFQRGDTHLVAAGAAGQLPCFKVLVAKNAANYVQGRISQS